MARSGIGRGRFWTGFLFALGFVSGCPVADMPGGQELRTELVYTRSGGFAGFLDEVTVLPDGTLTTSGDTFGNREGAVSSTQWQELLDLLDGWSDLRVSRGGSECCDLFVHSITYDNRTLEWSDVTPNVPARLLELAGFLRDLAIVNQG